MKPDQKKKADKANKEPIQLSTISSPKIRIKYFTCNEGKDHEGQVLNYVCVKKDCPKRGLFCSMCKINHQNHVTIPLKILLSKLQTHKQKPLQSSQGFQNQLQELEQIHKSMLYDLRICVESLAQTFREMQVTINSQFSKAKIELLERVQINMKFNQFIEEAINNRIENRQNFMQDITRISSMIEIEEEVKATTNKQKQLNIRFSAKFDEVVNNLKSIQRSVCQNMSQVDEFVKQLKIGKYQQASTKQKEKDKDKKGDEVKQESAQIKQSSSQIARLFTAQYKAATITLEQNKKVARQSKTGQGRFVFTNFQIKEAKQKMAFKIRVMKNWIGLGVGIRERLKFLNYKFEYSNLGHGSYLISSNGYSWSHTEQSNNIAVVSFKFKQGDIIELEYDKTKLIFSNKSTSQKYQLKLAFNEAEEKDIFFCANLCSEGDCVEVHDA